MHFLGSSTPEHHGMKSRTQDDRNAQSTMCTRLWWNGGLLSVEGHLCLRVISLPSTFKHDAFKHNAKNALWQIPNLSDTQFKC